MRLWESFKRWAYLRGPGDPGMRSVERPALFTLNLDRKHPHEGSDTETAEADPPHGTSGGE